MMAIWVDYQQNAKLPRDLSLEGLSIIGRLAVVEFMIMYPKKNPKNSDRAKMKLLNVE